MPTYRVNTEVTKEDGRITHKTISWKANTDTEAVKLTKELFSKYGKVKIKTVWIKTDEWKKEEG